MDGFVVNPYNVPWDSLNADPDLKGSKDLQKRKRASRTVCAGF